MRVAPQAESSALSHAPPEDSFARDNLPPPEQWPALLLERPEFRYPARFNCVTELLDSWLERGGGDRPCLRTHTEHWTYAEFAATVNRIAEVLTAQHGLAPGNRVLLRAPNTPLMVATYLAIIKAGGIVVATMPLLRRSELAYILDKAQIRLAVCDHRLLADLEAAQAVAPILQAIVPLGGSGPGDLTAAMRAASGQFAPHGTLRSKTSSKKQMCSWHWCSCQGPHNNQIVTIQR